MRVFKSRMFIVGIVLVVAAIVAMRPSPQASFDGASGDISISTQFSLWSVGALLVGATLMATSAIRARINRPR